MLLKNYISYILGTVDTYPLKVVKHLQKLFVAEGIAQKGAQLSFDSFEEESFDISDLAYIDAVKQTIEHSDKAVPIFEDWEYNKDYKYSVLFKCNDFDNVFSMLKDVSQKQPELKNEISIGSVGTPIFKHSENQILLKFSKFFSAIDPLEQSELLLKYPIIVIFDNKNKIVEFRFDAIKRVFLSEKREQNVYSDLIDDINKILREKYNIITEPFDLDYITNISNSDINGVNVMAEYRKLPNGGNAQLEVGNNENYILPIIGELKELITKHSSELLKVPMLAAALNQFIFENDELSDYTWIEVMWPDEVKTRSIRVKFIFNYKGYSYTLIQHYYNNILIGRERMDHVTEHIIQYKSIIQDEVRNE